MTDALAPALTRRLSRALAGGADGRRRCYRHPRHPMHPSHGRGGGGGGGPGPTPALFQSVNAGGRSVTYASPPTFDPVGDPEEFTVTSAGYTASGGTTTVDDLHICLIRERQAWPNHASLTTNQVRITDEIYVGDVLYGGAVNNSTLAAPRPICLSLNPDLVRASGTFTARVAVAHRHARNGRPVAAVKFILTDGTTTVEQIVSAMSTWVSVESGRSVPHFAHTFSLSGFTANAVLSLDWVIYPWRGALFDTRVSGAAAPSISFGTQRVFNDVSYGTAYVYVDPVLGNNTTGIASQSAAAAAALPFLNISNACTALRTYNNANFARDHVSGGVIRMVAGTATYQSLGTTQTGTMGDLPVLIEAAGGYATRATTIILQPATGGTTCPVRAILRNLTVRKNNATNVYLFDNAAGLASQNFVVFDAVAFDVNGFGSFGTAWIGKPGRCWMLDCTANGTNIATAFSTDNKAVNLIGGTVGPGTGVYNMAGVRHVGDDGYSTAQHGSGNRETSKGLFIGFSFLGRGSAASPTFGQVGTTIGVEGFALVGNILETSANGQPTCEVSSDGVVNPAQNLVIQMNTCVGERTNLLYQDTGTVTVAKSGSVTFNVFTKLNMKSDVFAANGNLIGNWPAIFKCGFRGNAFLAGDNNNSTFGTGNWMGEVRGLGEVAGTTAVPVVAAFVNPQAPGAGNGDYTPGAGSALPFIPAGLAPYPHDQLGRTVANDGTARAGALQMAA